MAARQVRAFQVSSRQAEILKRLSEGQSDKQVAATLGISVATVRSHLQDLYRAHGFHGRCEAVAAFVRMGRSVDGNANPVGIDVSQPGVTASIQLLVPDAALDSGAEDCLDATTVVISCVREQPDRPPALELRIHGVELLFPEASVTIDPV